MTTKQTISAITAAVYAAAPRVKDNAPAENVPKPLINAAEELGKILKSVPNSDISLNERVLEWSDGSLAFQFHISVINLAKGNVLSKLAQWSAKYPDWNLLLSHLHPSRLIAISPETEEA